MPRLTCTLKLDNYPTVDCGAELLDVSPWTLRHWDRAGKLRLRQHPVNCYRLYRRGELQFLLQTAADGERQEAL